MWHLTAVEWAMEAVRLLAAALIGGNVGSFLNVVAWRMPRGESVVFGRSHCPACGHLVRAVDNIPVIGWLRLRGRCRDCGGSIAARYPLVEAACAGLALVLVLADTATPAALPAHCLLFARLVLLALFERDGFEMPAEGLAAGLLVAVVGAAAVPGMAPPRPDWPWVGGPTSFASAAGQASTWYGLPPGGAAALSALTGAFAGWAAAACLPRAAPDSTAERDRASEQAVARQPAGALVLIGAFLGWQAVVATILTAWPLRLARARILAALGMPPSGHWCGDLCLGALVVLSAWRAAGG
jgi:leader peptidase (prepilin peptidase)/N-methyltransferase